MDKLFEKLTKGEVPSWLEVFAALNEVSDIDWRKLEELQLTLSEAIESGQVPKYPKCSQGEGCAFCA